MRNGFDAAATEGIKGELSQCVECHGPEGRGYKPYGGPDLTDDVWIYGGDAATIKSLAVYLWRTVQG